MKTSPTFSPFGNDLFGEPIHAQTASPVAQKFLVPPFSVLSARDGDWQARKRAWAALGIRGEVGRDAEAYNTTKWLRDKNNGGEPIGGSIDTGTSIFDPVLCECIYRWFSPAGGQVVDPFAGGSVRGVVASCLGRKYWGSELRAEQVEANREQAAQLCRELPPQYVCGDSMETLASAPDADLVFSCPPYGDLETYSDDPREFIAAALSPARVQSVEVVDPVLRAARAIVPDYQLSLAIGKEGQNARLAAKLTGWRIDIRSDTAIAENPPTSDAPPASATRPTGDRRPQQGGGGRHTGSRGTGRGGSGAGPSGPPRRG